ncbi:hypothetical protein OAS86_00850 [Gammaproteobacteria bacterium]|nr:hypothetical protein [Gammaproteobacteria bacterium]
MKTLIRGVVLAVPLTILAACGLDSDTSAGGTSENAADTTDIAGTYVGQISATASAPGVDYERTETSPTTIVISNDGRVVISAFDRTEEAQLDSNTLSGTVPIDETRDGITCVGSAFYSLLIKDGSIAGSVNGEGNCRDSTRTSPATVAGTLTASRQ